MADAYRDTAARGIGERRLGQVTEVPGHKGVRGAPEGQESWAPRARSTPDFPFQPFLRPIAMTKNISFQRPSAFSIGRREGREGLVQFAKILACSR